MYQFQFRATDDADWGQAIEIFDTTTNQPLADVATADFELEVSDCGCSVLTASTDDATITKPDDGVIQWIFTKTQMGGLDVRKQYQVGLVIKPVDGSTVQLFVGTLDVIDGGF